MAKVTGRRVESLADLQSGETLIALIELIRGSNVYVQFVTRVFVFMRLMLMFWAASAFREQWRWKDELVVCILQRVRMQRLLREAVIHLVVAR